jgi:hypothetical protein
MRRLLGLALTALVAASFVVVPPARADQGSSSNRSDTDFNATVALTLTNPGQSYSDAQGNRYLQGLVFTGPLSGWPVTGTLRLDANVAFQAGATTGEIDGNYVISDGGGNSFRGDLAETRVQESPSGLLVAARLNIEGGTGIFDDARGSARIAGMLPNLGATATAAALGPTFGVQQLAYGAPWAPSPLQFAGQPQYGVAPSAVALGPVAANGLTPTAFTPLLMDPSQPTLAVSGHVTLTSSPTTNALRNHTLGTLIPNSQVQLQSIQWNPDAQRAFQEAIRYFLNADDNDHRTRVRSDSNNSRGRGNGNKRD